MMKDNKFSKNSKNVIEIDYAKLSYLPTSMYYYVQCIIMFNNQQSKNNKLEQSDFAQKF